MTALLLLGLLVAGAWAYVRWAAYWVAHGVSAGWFIAGAPLAYVTPAVVLTALWFAVAWIWRTPRPPQARLGIAESVRLYIGEMLTLAASWPFLALHALIMRDPAPAPAQRPVILVHGVLINDGIWFWFKRRLERFGVGPVYTVNYGPALAGIESFAQQLAKKIDAVCAETGASKLVLIGHSMGGLVSRAYLRRFGGDRVARLITIGTPHHGSILALSFPGHCLGEMCPRSRWLAELNRDESRLPPVPTTSIWSRHDSMVIPQASAVLSCADNVPVVGIGHNALISDSDVISIVRRSITSPRAASVY